ncbi:MAG: DUF4932 domain-containing protein [candidate division Zixibacteria bacterium]|nr:DUF4932 domain-containing protein [candidate division Zixibacteria bacterium]
MKRPITIVVGLVMLLAGMVQSQEAIPQLQIEVDPRIELLAALEAVSDYDGRFGLITRIDFPYRKEVIDHFQPFADHPVVHLFDSLSAIGFAFDAPVEAMLYFTSPPELKPIGWPNDLLLMRAGGREALDRFMVLLRDFARETDFETFYKNHGAVYDSMVARVRTTISSEEYIKDLEEYFGARQHSYHIILAPLFHSGGFGVRSARPDGGLDIFFVGGPMGSESGLPYFGGREDFWYLTMHEFGHSFVNPVTARYRDTIEHYIGLYEPIKEQMTRQAYGTWESCVDEHIDRAVTARLLFRRGGPEAHDRSLADDRNNGFIYVDLLAAKLEEYESRRDRYKTFADFYPELLTVFNGLMQSDIVEEFGLDKFRGNMNAVSMSGEEKVLIVPTAETDTIAQRKIHAYVAGVRDLFYGDSPILPDSIALTQDLCDKVIIVYGTVSGNRWLARYAELLPFTVRGDTIVADSVYAGDNLRFISCWRNPANPAKGVMIYTATRAAYVNDINSVFHGPTDFVVARGSDVIVSGGYQKDGENWAFQSK